MWRRFVRPATTPSIGRKRGLAVALTVIAMLAVLDEAVEEHADEYGQEGQGDGERGVVRV